MNRYFCFAVFLIILSCSGNHKMFKVVGQDMENTFLSNSIVEYKKVGELKRNDVVVMHYYDKILQKEYDIVLRIFGLPGDTIRISAGNLYLNNKKIEPPYFSKFSYMANVADVSMIGKLKNYSFRRFSKNNLIMFIDQFELKKIKEEKLVDSIYRLVADSNMVESDIVKGAYSKFSNGYYLGPIYVPKIGDKIDDDIVLLSPNFLSEKSKGGIVREEFYYLIGDNLMNCYDSRNIGLVPKSAIVGVVVVNK